MRTDRINRRGLLKMMMGTSAAVMFSGSSALTNAMGIKSDTEIAAAGADTGRKPNVLLIIADDLGVGDVSCYGSEMITTPNVDRIAAEGILATDAHSTAAVCTPSRYSILTGEYYHRYPYNWNGESLVRPGQPTIASVFRDNGYATGYFGKVHTGWGEHSEDRKHRQDIDWNKELPRGVLEMGFDSYFGTPFTHNEPPFVFVKDRHVVGLEPDDPLEIVPKEIERGPWGWGISKGAKAAHEARPVDMIDPIVTQHTVDFIRANSEKPFFINFALVAPHVPVAPSDEFKGKTELGHYGDFVTQMDACVGRVLRTLEELDLVNDTIVIFTSDNGAIYHPREYKMGHRANLNWLGQKTDAWEGGVRIPFVMRWPGKIPAGKTVEPLVSLMDIPKTVWAAANIDAPEDAAPDSINQLDVLTCKTNKPARHELFMIGITGQALRSGDWVYIPKPGSQGVTTDPRMDWAMQMAELGLVNSDYDEEGNLKPDAPKAQLYNLKNDPSQSVNVIEKYPDIAAKLDARFKEVSKR
ncbi:Arylsulfatase [Limihaloglobus sulfuriphilus]|uniref:Arylsulfatase n=1 Tax=Limihaloglobus sulfuriphilus TaxID=1851148 RepID=A0A1Q2MG95_9BACT|nr:arylsulfatase [Limihaloglobus sulfuriphilus]AQQ71578.1 Arylsulfatase [Limihaloglobus sulfuriphilus]